LLDGLRITTSKSSIHFFREPPTTSEDAITTSPTAAMALAVINKLHRRRISVLAM
jgi:hypothetical protein